tara:strand:+ start:168 stop:422 length:255 start_codon:yes stop_codon:yes gene_type:complete
MAFKLKYGQRMNNSPIRLKGGATFDYTKSSKDLKSKYKSKKELKKMEPFKTQIETKRSNLKQGVKTAVIPVIAGILASKTKFVR